LAKIRKGFARAVERAGLEGVTPHILKHTAVTWAMQRGMPIERAAEYFSTSPEVLRRVYQAHHPEFTASAASMMRIEEN
ncbi:MAG: site-specific integrase, partial [Pseudomonadota bacterium]